MTDADRPSFVLLIEALCAAFSKEASAATLEAYWLGLSDLPFAATRTAVTKALREVGDFMPPPAMLRSLAGEVTAEERAIVAWRDVMRSWEHAVDLDDAAEAAVRVMGGWRRLGMMDIDDLEKYERKRFIEAYVMFWERGDFEVLPERGELLDAPAPLGSLLAAAIPQRLLK